MASSSIRSSGNGPRAAAAPPEPSSGADIDLGARDSLPDGKVQPRLSESGRIRPRRASRGGGDASNAEKGYNDSLAGQADDDRNAVPDRHQKTDSSTSNPDGGPDNRRASGGDFRRRDPSEVRTSGPVRGEAGRKKGLDDTTTGLGRGEG